MTTVTLTGDLVCRGDDEVRTVLRELPQHIALTRAEPGCLEFEVRQSEDPRVFHVAERFTGAAAFRAHQARVAASTWGAATAAIERRYEVEGPEA